MSEGELRERKIGVLGEPSAGEHRCPSGNPDRVKEEGIKVQKLKEVGVIERD